MTSPWARRCRGRGGALFLIFFIFVFINRPRHGGEAPSSSFSSASSSSIERSTAGRRPLPHFLHLHLHQSTAPPGVGRSLVPKVSAALWERSLQPETPFPSPPIMGS